MDTLLDMLAMMHPVTAFFITVALLALVTSAATALGAGLGMIAVGQIERRHDRLHISETDHAL